MTAAVVHAYTTGLCQMTAVDLFIVWVSVVVPVVVVVGSLAAWAKS